MRFIQAHLFYLLSWIEQKIKTIYVTNPNARILVMVDEAHLIVDANNPKGMFFMYQLSKRIRKRNGAFVLATQNVSDLNQTQTLAKYTTALLNNAQYQVLFKFKTNDLAAINQLYQPIGGLMQQELNYLSKAKQGECLILANEYERHLLNIKIFPFEWELFCGR